jgi:hypothetical protein
MNHGAWKKWRSRADLIAWQLGVTPAGLSQLAKGVATTGTVRGGNIRKKLVEQGYAEPNHASPCSEITEAGFDLVRRARMMGW